MAAFGVLLLILSPVGHTPRRRKWEVLLSVCYTFSTGSPQICFGGCGDLLVNSREWSLLVKLSENEVTYQWKEWLISLVFMP